jgi:hypothetical protein
MGGIERHVHFAAKRGDNIDIRSDQRIDSEQNNCGSDGCSQCDTNFWDVLDDCTKIEANCRKWQVPKVPRVIGIT